MVNGSWLSDNILNVLVLTAERDFMDWFGADLTSFSMVFAMQQNVTVQTDLHLAG